MLNIGEESKAKAEESFDKLMQEVLEVKTTLSVIKQNPVGILPQNISN